MGLPCRHIAAALYTAAMHDERHPLFLEEKNIRPRWRCQQHPVCTLFVSTCEPNVRNPNALGTNSSSEFNCNLLSKIKAPSKVATRFSKLQEICGPLLEEGKTNVYNYKVVMAYLSKAVNGIHEFLQSDGTGDCMDFIEDAPMIRNAANKNDRFTSIVNHANRRNMMCLPTEVRKRKRTVACDACLYYQNAHVTSHRAYSQQCPQRSNPNHIKNPAQAAETRKKFDVVSQSALTIA